MIKGIWSGVTVFLILTLSAASYGWEFKLRGDHDWEYRYDLGWEGRMRGMGRPQGLVPGGTDLFTHPVKILNTQGSRFYGHLGYRYTDVDADTRMDVDADIPPQFPFGLDERWRIQTSGDIHQWDAHTGTTFPLGPGRMGLFFFYNGIREDYDGRGSFHQPGFKLNLEEEVDRGRDDFSMRLIYGLPLNGVALGGAAGLSYVNQETTYHLREWETFIDQGLWNDWYDMPRIYPYPLDTKYWTADLTGSAGFPFGPLDVTLSLFFGFDFCGDMDWDYRVRDNVFGWKGDIDMDGDVDGWRVGGDLWLRYHHSDRISFPFLVKADYRRMKQHGDAPGQGVFSDSDFELRLNQRYFRIEAGGGVDMRVNEATRNSMGLFYSYHRDKSHMRVRQHRPFGTGTFDNTDWWPGLQEHRVTLRFAAERPCSPHGTGRFGVNAFYGWVDKDPDFDAHIPGDRYYERYSLDGHRWGVEASVGASMNCRWFTWEPYLYGRYQRLSLDGGGSRSGISPGTRDRVDIKEDREEWSVGGGISFIWDF